MSQNVYTLPPNIIKDMQVNYSQSLVSAPQGAIFRAKTAHAVITAYKSGKVLFQGSAPEVEMAKWENKAAIKDQPKQTRRSVSNHSLAPPTTLFENDHIGSDESGTGDYFGPVTVACVYVKQEQIKLLRDLGIQDSKKLTDLAVQKLSKEIIQLRIPYSLLILHNEKYNTLQKQGWSQGKMKAMLHHHAIDTLLDKINDAPYDGILIDQFCTPDVYKRYIATEQEVLAPKTYFMTKAESYSIAVAAGSIIARASFLNEMDKLSENLGVPLRKGASKHVDQLIAKIIADKGYDTLNSCAKTHFVNTEKAKAYM